jgi:hypothetical protein
MSVFRHNFPDALEAELRAIERSKAPLPYELSEATLPLPAPTIEHAPEELKGPMSRLVRRF